GRSHRRSRFDAWVSLLSCCRPVAHSEREFARVAKDAAGLLHTALTKPRSFCGLCCRTLFAAPALLGLRVEQREAHGLLAPHHVTPATGATAPLARTPQHACNVNLIATESVWYIDRVGAATITGAPGEVICCGVEDSRCKIASRLAAISGSGSDA